MSLGSFIIPILSILQAIATTSKSSYFRTGTFQCNCWITLVHVATRTCTCIYWLAALVDVLPGIADLFVSIVDRTVSWKRSKWSLTVFMYSIDSHVCGMKLSTSQYHDYWHFVFLFLLLRINRVLCSVSRRRGLNLQASKPFPLLTRSCPRHTTSRA